MEKTGVFVSAYCCHRKPDGQLRLTAMAQTAMETGLALMEKHSVPHILVSVAYKGLWRHELALQQALAEQYGVSRDALVPISGIEHSYGEAKKVLGLAESSGVRKLFVVAEKWHAPRARLVFEGLQPADMTIEVVPFETPRYERAVEPLWIKSFRAGHKWAWILWNKLLELAHPFMMRRYGNP